MLKFKASFLVYSFVLVTVLLASLLWVFSLGARAAGPCNVPSASYPTIQAAIDDVGCDPILLTAPLYNETAIVTRDVIIQGQDPAQTVIDGNNSGSVFTIEADLEVTLSDMTIRDGNAALGGGILNLTSTLTIRNAHIIENVAEQGAGVYNQAGSLFLESSQVFGNDASVAGGGIAAGWTDSPVYVDDSFINENSAGVLGGAIAAFPVSIENSTISQNDAGSFGGGIYGRATISNSLIISNTSDYGAGLYTFVLTATNSTIEGNIALRTGGGIFSHMNSSVNLDRCTIHDNVAVQEGGGILIDNTTAAQIWRSTISGNRAPTGAGIYVGRNSSLTLETSTVSNNEADFGGGIATRESGTAAAISNSTIAYNVANDAGGGLSGNDITIVNTIVAQNVTGADCDGAIVSLGYNLDSDNTCNLIDVSDLPNVNPLLGPLQNNGGSTLTHALMPGSPAIDLGTNSICLSPDQRGVVRPLDGDDNGSMVCDIGAYEALGFANFGTFLPIVRKPG